MRSTSLSLLLLAASAAPLHAEEAGGGLMSPSTGLMFWTLLIFVMLFLVLQRYAFPAIIGAVQAREKSLEDAINAAKHDRDEAARLLSEHRAALDASRNEGQKIIADARTAAERVRAELIEAAHAEQAQMLARARQEIASETAAGIAALRREAVDLAIAGASKVIEKNLDQATNRQLVESFLASVQTSTVKASR